MRICVIVLSILFVMGCLTARGSEDYTATIPDNYGTNVPATVFVKDVSVSVTESDPPKVSVIVEGTLGDMCTTIQSIERDRRGSTFYLIIKAVRPAGKVCGQMLKAFRQTIGLDVAGLTAGTYTVIVNDVKQTFELSKDVPLKATDQPGQKMETPEKAQPTTIMPSPYDMPLSDHGPQGAWQDQRIRLNE